MASPVSSLYPVAPPPIPKPRRAKRTKWCHDCRSRIEVGTLYLEWDSWRWTHLTDACPDGWGASAAEVGR